MSDDVLERATKALREQAGAEPPTDRSAFMRARLMSQTGRSSKLRPQSVWQWAAVIGLGFFVSTAMAQVIAVQLPKLIEALRSEPATEPQKPKPAKPKPSKKAAQPTAAADAQPAPNVLDEPGAPSGSTEPPAQPEQIAAPAPTVVTPAAPAHEPALRSERGAPTPRRRESAAPKRSLSANIPAKPSIAPTSVEPVSEPVPEPSAAPAEPEPRVASASPPSPPPKAAAPESAELALFRRAQALHVVHDPRAINAWDAFLRVAGSSVLAPEARYNRALGLVRASRFDEARRALKPFAAGAYGAYRKDEAQALLTRLPE